MRIVTIVVRTLLGLLFVLAGVFGFVLLFIAPPPLPPGLASDLQTILFRTHWVQFIDVIELIAGVLLVAGRYVPLSLTLLGAVIYNILVFHVTMMPQTLALPVVVFACWVFLAWRYRSSMAPLFSRDARPD